MSAISIKKFLAGITFLFIFAFPVGARAATMSLKKGEVFLYPINFKSADTALFGGVKIPVFDYAGKKYALIAVDVSKNVGNYNLRIKNGEKELLKKLVAVKEATYTQTIMKVPYKFATLPKGQQESVTKDKAPLVSLLSSLVTEPKAKLWKSPFRNPLDIMTTTSSFGYKRIYTNYSTVHQGIDLRAKIGTPVYAISDGEVLWGEDQKALYLEGPMIAIDHGDGIVSKYLHLSKIIVRSGAMVKAGDIIGYSGDQGADVSGAHLHFAIKVGNASVSPLQFIKEFQKLK